jgi:hypothetical protein
MLVEQDAKERLKEARLDAHVLDLLVLGMVGRIAQDNLAMPRTGVCVGNVDRAILL